MAEEVPEVVPEIQPEIQPEVPFIQLSPEQQRLQVSAELTASLGRGPLAAELERELQSQQFVADAALQAARRAREAAEERGEPEFEVAAKEPTETPIERTIRKEARLLALTGKDFNLGITQTASQEQIQGVFKRVPFTLDVRGLSDADAAKIADAENQFGVTIIPPEIGALMRGDVPFDQVVKQAIERERKSQKELGKVAPPEQVSENVAGQGDEVASHIAEADPSVHSSDLSEISRPLAPRVQPQREASASVKNRIRRQKARISIIPAGQRRPAEEAFFRQGNLNQQIASLKIVEGIARQRFEQKPALRLEEALGADEAFDAIVPGIIV